jgi:GH15 family glucan-1,4-alpha-glucosidase
MALPIEDYAMIGDCQTAALVGRDGSIDWLCLPYFNSSACFASLLGNEKHGRWKIAPTKPLASSRRYREGTLILETDFETADGAVTLVDGMPPRSGEPDVVRMVVGRRGTVSMRMELIIRSDYGSIVPWVRRTDHGIRAIAGPDSYLLDCRVPLHGENLSTVATFDVHAGERIPFVFMWHPSHQPAPPRCDPIATLNGAERWWREWSARCTYDGPWKEAVVRSLITLKALTFMPTGGIVAAATTSLPEQLGGVRNWDYRFCWVRDATFTLYSLLNNGYTDEATAWRKWLLRAVAGRPEQINIMYGIGGERRLTELELPWLPGYENSKPVRIGNAAYSQFQLDVFGELMDALFLARHAGLEHDENSWRVQRLLMHFLEHAWKNPDEGIWEIRGPRRHFTHSKVMAWVAVDRMVRTVEDLGDEGPLEKWKALRGQMHEEICRRGFNAERNTFVQSYGRDELDASLLMLPLVGFLPPDDPRIRGTVAAIEQDLLHDGLLARYPTKAAVDGLPPGEGAFLACTFWLVDNYVLQGRRREAEALFERLLALRNDVGLLSEQYDAAAGRLVGNFPQAFSHVGLVNTARNLTTQRAPAQQRRTKSSSVVKTARA